MLTHGRDGRMESSLVLYSGQKRSYDLHLGRNTRATLYAMYAFQVIFIKM